MLYIPAVLLVCQVMPFHPHKEASALDLGIAAPSQQYQQALDSEQELLRVCATLKDVRSATYQTLDKVGAQDSGYFLGCFPQSASAHTIQILISLSPHFPPHVFPYITVFGLPSMHALCAALEMVQLSTLLRINSYPHLAQLLVAHHHSALDRPGRQ